jgi:PAS domain-containing protein
MVPLLTELQFAPGMVVYAAISGLLYRTIPWMLPLIIAPVVLAHLAVNKIIVSLDEAELTTAERDRLQASVGGVDDGVILVDGRLSPQLVSPSMALLLGAGDDALDRRTLDHLVPLVDESWKPWSARSPPTAPTRNCSTGNSSVMTGCAYP